MHVAERNRGLGTEHGLSSQPVANDKANIVPFKLIGAIRVTA